MSGLWMSLFSQNRCLQLSLTSTLRTHYHSFLHTLICKIALYIAIREGEQISVGKSFDFVKTVLATNHSKWVFKNW